MLRSASLAFFEMARVCCGPQASNCWRVIRRTHEEHCGSSVELRSDAIGRVAVQMSDSKEKEAEARWTVRRHATILEILATTGGGSCRASALSARQRWWPAVSHRANDR